MPQIRMLALDIDGTLAAEGDRISEPTHEALRRAHAAGVVVSIATGRRFRTAMRIVDALALSSPLVCLGGALVKDAGGNTLHASSFPVADFDFVAACFRELGHTAVGQCAADGSTGEIDFIVDDATTWNDATRGYCEQNAAHAHRFSSAQGRGAHADDVLVVGAFGDADELASLCGEVERRAPGRFSLTLMTSGRGRHSYLEVIPADVSKWHGLRRLADALGIATDAICAVGDERNDLPMIRGAALGVAMGNALPEVQAEADWVTGRHDEDGLVAVVERILDAG